MIRKFLATFIVASLFFVSLGQTAQSAPSNKQLVIGIAQEFETLNPITTTTVVGSYILRMTNHVLTVINKDWQWECQLCVELPTIENGMARVVEKDGKKKLEVDFEIRSDAFWGDGKPVTGHDVKKSWEIGLSPNVSNASREQYEYIEDIKVDSKNPKKITLIYKEAKYNFNQLGQFWIIPAHVESPVWEKVKTIPNGYDKQTIYNTAPDTAGLYNGPYVISEIKSGSHVILKKNPQFKNNPAKIEKIVIKVITDTSTLEANLLSGTIDMVAELGMKFDQAHSFEKRIKQNSQLKDKYIVHFKDGLIFEHIDINTRNEILKDVRVRQALLYGADRGRLVKALFDNRQKKSTQNFHTLDVYHDKTIFEYPYDSQKAGELLDQAGWKLGSDGFRYKNDQKLSLVLMTTAQDKTRELVQVFLQNQWKKIGIEIKIKNEPARVFFGKTVRRAEFPHLAMYAWISSPDNPPFTVYHSKMIPTEKNGYSGQNRSGWNRSDVDELLDGVYNEFDVTKRKEMMSQLMRLYKKDLPVLPLYHRAEIAVTPSSLTGFGVTGHMYYSSVSVNQWSFE